MFVFISCFLHAMLRYMCACMLACTHIFPILIFMQHLCVNVFFLISLKLEPLSLSLVAMLRLSHQSTALWKCSKSVCVSKCTKQPCEICLFCQSHYYIPPRPVKYYIKFGSLIIEFLKCMRSAFFTAFHETSASKSKSQLILYIQHQKINHLYRCPEYCYGLCHS